MDTVQDKLDYIIKRTDRLRTIKDSVAKMDELRRLNEVNFKDSDDHSRPGVLHVQLAGGSEILSMTVDSIELSNRILSFFINDIWKPEINQINSELESLIK